MLFAQDSAQQSSLSVQRHEVAAAQSSIAVPGLRVAMHMCCIVPSRQVDGSNQCSQQIKKHAYGAPCKANMTANDSLGGVHLHTVHKGCDRCRSVVNQELSLGDWSNNKDACHVMSHGQDLTFVVAFCLIAFSHCLSSKRIAHLGT